MVINSQPPVGPPFETIRDVIIGLNRLENHFLRERDRRGVFVIAYRLITETLEQWITQERFWDNLWVERYVVSFANLYQDALRAYLDGSMRTIPKSWHIALETSESGFALVIQDLFLGINAHINRDLAFALNEVGINGENRYEDHCLVNDALREATATVQDQISDYYASGLGLLDHLLGNLDEQLAQFHFEVAREHAWSSAGALHAASTNEQRSLVAGLIEKQAKMLAQTILTPNTHLPWLIDVLKHIEQLKPWYDHFGSVNQVGAPKIRMLSSNVSGPVSDLDAIIEKLTEQISRWDLERNRLSIYATVYRRITQRVKETVEAGGFRDPDWMVKLDVLFANRYFDVIEKYEMGRINEIPRCWAFALETVSLGRTMIVQDIGVQIAPRVIFDLPITLVEAGISDNLEARKYDYEKTYDLFIDELDCIQQLIARKYSRLVTFMDILAGRLDEMISNVLYTQARREAWEDALALHNANSDTERNWLINSFNRKTNRAINEMLFYNEPPLSWMVRVVRRLEDTFSGDWSDTVEDCD